MNATEGNPKVGVFRSDAEELRRLLFGMRDAYTRGENVMEYARRLSDSAINTTVSTLIAYDLQAGSYIAGARANPEANNRWCEQLAYILSPFLAPGDTVLEVGCGEATTLGGVLQRLAHTPGKAFGFDISWSRVAHGLRWLKEKNVDATLFVADLFNIPLGDSSVDIVYTSHSLEPNGGREEPAIRELLRVARRAVVLIEPIYELAKKEAQQRMMHHGYVRGLKEAAERAGAAVTEYRLLDHISNPLNPSGVLVLEKVSIETQEKGVFSWCCPLTYTRLCDEGDVFVSKSTGIAYPVLRAIPMLRREHAIVASGISLSAHETTSTQYTG